MITQDRPDIAERLVENDATDKLPSVELYSKEMRKTMELTITKGFTQKTCGECGVIFWVPDELETEFKKTGQAWCCPNGHRRAYTESQTDRYKRMYEQTERYLQNARAVSERLERELKKCQASKPKAKKAVKK